MGESYDFQQYLVKLQEGNILNGVTNEPRAFFDTIEVPEAYKIQQGHSDVFRNGENFPIRLTHLVAAMARLTVGDQRSAVSPNEIQRVGMRLEFHDSFYMNEYSSNALQTVSPNNQQGILIQAPAWQLNPTAAAAPVSPGGSAWAPRRPFILSVQDTMRVDVMLDAAPADVDVVAVTVTFTGVGVLSGRPYFFSGTIFLTTAVRATISTDNYRNDGSEPVVITDVTVNTNYPTQEDPTGDISRVFVAIKQIGNGTTASWFQGPVNAEPLIVSDMMPAVLLGQQSGRCIVHRFPGNGLIWEPGNGLVAQIQNSGEATAGSQFHIGLLGYISVQ